MRLLGLTMSAVMAAPVAWGATNAKTAPTTTCGQRAMAYAEKVAAAPDSSSADEWDRLGRDCLERGAYADGVRTFRRGLAHHPELQDRMNNLGAVYTESGRHELAYCLVPKNKAYKKAWERTKRTSRLCPETEKKGFLFVPPDLRGR